jgi:cyclohexa-1,5-dienecarbonyl-CoA hydratase
MSDALRVWLEREGALLRLRLDRPKANVLDSAMVSALNDAFEQHESNIHLKAILIDGAGPHFSFGASVPEHLPDQCAAMLGRFHQLLLRIVRSQVPVLMAIQGQCLGGGLELAASGHVIFAAPDASLGQPEIQLGVFAPAASCLLPERIGLAAAEDLLISGRSISGTEALAVGLVSAVAPDVEAAALAYFDRHLAGKSASSLRYALRAARRGFAERVAKRLAEVEELYLTELMQSKDALEGLTAFIERRQAQWKDI